MAASGSQKELFAFQPGPIADSGKICADARIELKNILETERLQEIMDDFYQLTQMGTSIIDMNGEVLVKAGWHNICTHFHRKHPQTLKNCIESETNPTEDLKEGETIGYKCKNHMWHVVTPIIVEGQHVGNVFLGQFFYDDEVLDTSKFVEQAERYGFEKEEYLAALRSVPVWSREKVETSVRFCVNLTTLISMLSLTKLNLLRENAERRRIEEAYRKMNEKLNLLNGITRHDINNQLVVLKGHLDLAMKGVQDPVTVSRMVKMDRAVDNISAQISFTKDYQELGAAAPRWQKVSELVADHVRALDIHEPAVCERGRNLELFADPMLGKVFYNLLEDSVKYGGKNISTRLCCTDCDGDLLVVYEDDGIGIACREREHLFQRGYGRGTGLGLCLSKEILSITGMTIRECGEYGKGVKFEIRVPRGMYRFDNNSSL
jgi:polar amino acid transport system substrate-binding protein